MLNTAEFAIKFICDRDEEFGALVKRTSTIRAVYIMLTSGGFDLKLMHSNGSLRQVLNAMIA
jgi:hypothetical protein